MRACIRRGLSPANTIRPQSTGLVCGAGGMARAAIYSMISLGVRNIFICNRTLEHARSLAEHYNDLIAAGEISELSPDSAAQSRIRVIESFASSWPSNFRQPTMIVCCIPTHAADGSLTNFTLPEGWLKSPNWGVVVDAAYRQRVSTIVRQMRERVQAGWILMHGYDVVPEQAYSQFEIFTGRRAPRKLMRDQVLKHYPADEDQQDKPGSAA